MLLRLCGPPSISLSFNLATVLPRRCTYRVSSGTGGVNSPYTKCTPFKVGTTRVSNPVCSPNFRVSVSVSFQRAAFATGVLLDINAFHRYTKNSALPSCTLVKVVLNAVPRLGLGLSHPTCLTAYAPFTPSKSEQRSPPLYYRGCWHRVSRGFLLRYHHPIKILALPRLFPHDSSLQPEGLHPARGVASSRFRALRKILDCSLP